MGKYYTFKHNYKNKPASCENFREAIIQIGKKDPYNVKRTKLVGCPPINTYDFTEKDYFNRGVLNIRKHLNTHLGISGKYTNRMIRLSSEFKIIIDDDKIIWIKTMLPKKDFKVIVSATYNILRKCDKQFCEKLFKIEEGDAYEMKDFYKSSKFKTIAPIQTNTIIRTAKGKTEAITEFANDFRKDIITVK